MAARTCTNERCTCTPCVCSECRCGLPRLGELERRVMDVLWDRNGEELTGRDVADALPAYAYTTIVTVLERLSRKGEVLRQPAGNLLVFSATGSGATHTARVLRAALDDSSDRSGALQQLVSSLSVEEAAALRAALSKTASRRRGDRRTLR